ncbi:unnamed protein product [Adineta ricciae]|uniref:Ubiquitin-specific peptidase-like SUMO isopeptidase domain-containing protein n=1 Tax=Adineta ricciae TaxID=249248 RepID=A0A814CZQ9_ADIRI|nr:unnamed protein product [Adineta ricciae]CAF1287540.1 unnamed protein product [Adineta ricciae]
MSTTPNESIWSSMIAARQLSVTFYTLSTCLTDLLHRYNESALSQANKTLSSALLHNLDQTLFSTSSNSSKLFDEYSNILQNTLKQNSLHTNVIQNVRRLFRSDACLKELFTTELNEHCQCQECDCTISNSITDFIHDVGEIKPTLLIQPCQTSCACFRCGDQNQLKTITFKQSSPCLALTVNRLNITPTEQLTNAQGAVYELVYIIELDSASRTIINVYLRKDNEFVKVDGSDVSSRSTTINSQGKFLTLWLITRSAASVVESSQPTNTLQTHTYLSPPQSASSSSQLASNSQTTTETSIPDQNTNVNNFDDFFASHPPLNADVGNEDEVQFWNSVSEQSATTISEDLSIMNDPVSEQSATTISEDLSITNDPVSDIYLTLLHSSTKESAPIESQADHDRAVNSLASDVLWPLIVERTKRRSEKKTSSSSTATTIRSISSNSSTTSSTFEKNRAYKQLPSISRLRRPHPYTTT